MQSDYTFPVILSFQNFVDLAEIYLFKKQKWTQWKYLTSITSAVNPGTMEIEDIPFSAFRIIIHKSLIPPEKFLSEESVILLLWQVHGIVLSPLIFSVFHIFYIFHSLWLIRMRKQPFPLKFPRKTLWVLPIRVQQKITTTTESLVSPWQLGMHSRRLPAQLRTVKERSLPWQLPDGNWLVRVCCRAFLHCAAAERGQGEAFKWRISPTHVQALSPPSLSYQALALPSVFDIDLRRVGCRAATHAPFEALPTCLTLVRTCAISSLDLFICPVPPYCFNNSTPAIFSFLIDRNLAFLGWLENWHTREITLSTWYFAGSLQTLIHNWVGLIMWNLSEEILEKIESVDNALRSYQ